MKRLIAALALSLVAAAPAAAAERSDDTAKPIVFLSGGETGTVDCKALWKPLQSQLKQLRIVADGKIQRFVTTPMVNVSTYAGDKNCEFNLGVADDQGVEAHARALADWLKKTFGPTGESFDVVAAGTGGVVLRAALALEPSLRLEDAVTLNTPHAGARDLFDDCSRKVCEQLDNDKDVGKAFIATKLASWDNPQGAIHTDWTVIGSAADTVVSADSAIAMDAEHKTIYLKDYPKQFLTHTSLISNTTDGKTAKITYSHRGTDVSEWRKAPWPAERIGNDLVAGASGATADGNGSAGDANCSGYNDASGPIKVEDPGLAVWGGTKKQMSFIRTGILEAFSDCFAKAGPNVYSSATTVRLNGLDIKPGAGHDVTIDVKKRLVQSDEMSMSIPSQWWDKLAVPLAQNEPLNWIMPKEAGALSGADIDGFGTSGKFKLFGLPLKGLHKLSLGQGYTSLEVNVGIPGSFSGSAPRGDGYVEQPQCSNHVDDDQDGKIDFAQKDPDCTNPNDNYESSADGPGFIGSVRADNTKGLIVDKLGGSIEGNMGLGKLRIGGASFWYSRAENEWEASLSATPPINRMPEVKVTAGVKEGSLKRLSGEATNIGWGPFWGGLYLQRAKIGYVFGPDWEATVGLGMSWGPRVYTPSGPISIVDVDGDLTVNDDGFKLASSLYLLGDKWGNGSVAYKSGSGVTVSADFGIDKEYASKDGKNAFKAEIKGKFNGTFNSGSVDLSATAGMCFEGKLSFGPISSSVENTCLAQGSARVTAAKNTLAFSACGQLDLGVITTSVGYATKAKVVGGQLGMVGEKFADSCDFDSWHTAANAAQAGGTGVSLGSGLDAAMIAVTGDGAPPRVALRGPGGAAVAAPTAASGIVRGDGYAFIHSPADNTTYVFVAKPDAGRWTVEPQPGSSRVLEVKSADKLPEPEVSAKVRGHRIEWAVKSIPGQTVRLRELGPNVSASLGTLRGAKGTLRFKPAFGRGGTRRIVADVLQDGAPRESLTVARYKAPALKTLAAPKRVVVRGGSVRWTRVAGATGYSVTVSTSDGRELAYDVTGRKVTVKRLAGHALERIVVRALRADGKLGRAKTLKP